MPNFVNEMLLDELRSEVRSMGSCLVVAFDALTVKQAEEIRNKFRTAGVSYAVVKNRLAAKAFSEIDVDLRPALKGKCGIVFAKEEKAIGAAKLVREFTKKLKQPPLVVAGGVIEGEAIVGRAAETIADMPDRHTVNGMLATALSAPARSLACAVAAVAGGLARCLQAKIDKSAAPN
jgi:large subunit ribosomal protein L10